MNIHEYQAKQLFKTYNIPVLKGFVVDDHTDIERTLRKIETDRAVIKAQIHAGGRGKAGGVKLVETMAEGIDVIKNLLSKTLITHQTSLQGLVVKKVYVEEACHISKEWYLSMVLNREKACVSILFSEAGGVDIESEDNQKIKTLDVDTTYGLKDYDLKALVSQVGVSAKIKKDFIGLIKNMYTLYVQKDALLIEINPLVITKEDDLVALDAKMTIDDNALFRQEEIQSFMDPSEDERAAEAAQHDLAFVGLEGEIACMVNGAGLALATLDAIDNYGGSPANFLDVGGSARPAQMAKAFEIIMKDNNVKGIFINIFGGIMQGEYVAQGIIEGQKHLKKQMPIVVRLEGSGCEAGKDMLAQEGIQVTFVDSLDQGAEAVVALCGGVK